MNLVGPGPIAPHLEDADAVARILGQLAQRSAFSLDDGHLWADLGSGAGFPGVALAAHHPQIRVHLIESREKRAVFLRRLAQDAGLLNAEVCNQRVESVKDSLYDGVIARAFAPPERYLPMAAALAKPGAFVVLLANDLVKKTAEMLTEFHVERYRSGGKDRLLIVFRKNRT